MKYNKMAKMQLIKIENGKKEFTKSKNKIKENLKRKIYRQTFCTNSYISTYLRIHSDK